MRSSVRIGSAAALICVALILIYSSGHGDHARSLLRIEKPSSHRKWNIGTNTKAQLTYQTRPIDVPNIGSIIMGKLKSEDTAWVSAELAEWRNIIYTVDDPFAPLHTPKNKGRESLPYLQYIVDHYEDLPETMVFLHPHRDGWPAAWHTDTMDYNNVDSVRALQTSFIQENGFANLRCQQTPGCPVELQPFRKQARSGNEAEKYYAQAWEELFNNTDVPEKIGAACCSQFAVSRDQVLKRSLSEYQRMYDWVLNTELPDQTVATIMEYSWHIIFGQEPVYCPNVFQCYADVYGEELIF
ncbi:hypothetical protein N7474_002226 [Penicillium riverlandense]|uniref:uncharacterized protein n=1 Tax=Penicillium riverlandense TaxID=1903569 RepID=UPI002548752E|nr:uncharacterized protein N7474_002226 [Penicillium riverlandense]KAJ5833915.1 hypothetical protein N7474_002226 [Penicillium riverlandense]